MKEGAPGGTMGSPIDTSWGIEPVPDRLRVLGPVDTLLLWTNLGISLPGTFEEPKAPVYVDGRLMTTLKGDRIVAEFIQILNDYVDSHYAPKEQLVSIH